MIDLREGETTTAYLIRSCTLQQSIYIYVTSARTDVTHTKETIYLALFFAIYFRYFEFLHCETNSLKSFK